VPGSLQFQMRQLRRSYLAVRLRKEHRRHIWGLSSSDIGVGSSHRFSIVGASTNGIVVVPSRPGRSRRPSTHPLPKLTRPPGIAAALRPSSAIVAISGRLLAMNGVL